MIVGQMDYAPSDSEYWDWFKIVAWRDMVPELVSASSPTAFATCTNYDGSVIGGTSSEGTEYVILITGTDYTGVATLWIKSGDLPYRRVRLDHYLRSHGIDPGDFFPTWVCGMSWDGRTIAGVGRNGAGVYSSFVAFIESPVHVCNDLDFNNDGLWPDNLDLEDFLSVFGGGPCSRPGCDGLDFNADGLFPDHADLEAFLRVFSGGPC
ncbi:MAG TPA: hypothetical protein VD971_03660 [Phycisphaerales bacterium]|nr:hypothetical protein [Phycisphaerales bacterium]